MEPFIAEIETFCSAQSLTEGQFGILALNDKNFVAQLKGGRDLRVSTLAKVREFMTNYAPAEKAA